MQRQLKEALALIKNAVHPLHWLELHLRRQLLGFAVDMSLVDLVIAEAPVLCERLPAALVPNHPEIARVHFELGDALLRKAKKQYGAELTAVASQVVAAAAEFVPSSELPALAKAAQENLRSAKEIWTICYGQEHGRTKRSLDLLEQCSKLLALLEKNTSQVELE